MYYSVFQLSNRYFKIQNEYKVVFTQGIYHAKQIVHFF